MNAFDVTVLVLCVAAGWGGWRLGLVTRLASWLGLAIGLVVGLRLAPIVVRAGGLEGAGALVAATAVLVATGLGLQAVGLAIGARLGPREVEGAADRANSVGGALAGIGGVLVVVWLLLPVLGAGFPELSRQASSSRVALALDRWLPAPPDASQALRSVVDDDAFPQVFDQLRATPDLGPPPPASGLDQVTAERVAASVVAVESPACDVVRSGTGWVGADGLVVTNAHVVAAAERPVVVRDDGVRFDATVVAFDGQRDLAVLAVEGLRRPPLALRSASPGDIGGVFGHPSGGPLRIAPGRVATLLDATGRDIYGDPGADRAVLELAASLQRGDSGAPFVTADGSVLGVVFAVAADRDGVSYALAPSEVAVVLDGPLHPVDTGPCLV